MSAHSETETPHARAVRQRNEKLIRAARAHLAAGTTTTRARLAERCGVSPCTVGRVLQAEGLEAALRWVRLK